MLSCLVCLPVWGSEPGEPLDCSDWVFLNPGFSCSDYNPYPSETGYDGAGGKPGVIGNRGFLYQMETEPIGRCGFWNVNRINLVRYRGSTSEVVAYIDGRCVNAASDDVDSIVPYPPSLLFDRDRGRMLIGFTVRCNGDNCSYADGRWTAAIEGFGPLFNIFLSFIPESNNLSFNVPYAPEGLQYADWFNTYRGNISDLPTFDLMQPLQCAYPATAPAVGDYLTITDTDSPAAGHGFYYLTAVNFMGQLRYGRQAIAGVLSGRDPAVLPGCAGP